MSNKPVNTQSDRQTTGMKLRSKLSTGYKLLIDHVTVIVLTVQYKICFQIAKKKLKYFFLIFVIKCRK